MTEDVIEHYDNFNTKVCPDKLIFGKIYDHPIPPDYYDFLNDKYGDYDNTPGTPVDDFFPDN